jgi:hypothetical protein
MAARSVLSRSYIALLRSAPTRTTSATTLVVAPAPVRRSLPVSVLLLAGPSLMAAAACEGGDGSGAPSTEPLWVRMKKAVSSDHPVDGAAKAAGLWVRHMHARRVCVVRVACDTPSSHWVVDLGSPMLSGSKSEAALLLKSRNTIVCSVLA